MKLHVHVCIGVRTLNTRWLKYTAALVAAALVAAGVVICVGGD